MLDPNRESHDAPRLARTGVAALDEHLGGGFVAGRIHLLTGGVGTGKSMACMHFLGAGLQAGERVVLLTAARPADARAQAAYAGVPLDAFLRQERLIVLRYRPTFGSHLAHAASPAAALDDLARLIGAESPSRIAVDPIVPFLRDGSPVGAGLTALGEFLERLGATALLTWPGDVANGTDRRFDGLIGSAASVVRLERHDDGVVECSVLRSGTFRRSQEPLLLKVVPRSGIVAVDRKATLALSEGSAAPRTDSRRITLMHATDVASPEILELLHRNYEVSVTPLAGSPTARTDAARGSGHPGAIVIETHHEALDETHAFLARSAAASSGASIAVAVRFNLRSIDRARLLRAGADDVLATDMGPAEFLARLGAIVGRGPRSGARRAERLPSRSDLDARAGGLLDRAAFASGVASHSAFDPPARYTVTTLAPPRAARGTDDERAALSDLSALVIRSARVGSGDLVGCFDGQLAVYLHGARRGDASPFIDRVRSAWPARERGSIEVDFLSYPSDEPRLRTLMGASPQS